MSEKRIQFSNIVQNQLPVYTRDEFPLVSEFLKSYYEGQEYQGGPIDLAQNIDEYVKVDNLTNLTGQVGLKTDITLSDETIEVDMVNFPAGTEGFPKSYGLIKIDSEIITYTGITTTAFTGCIRGFCGITSYKAETKPDVLVFNSSTSEGHIAGSKVENLSSLFLNEFLLKTKNQLLPGLENRSLSSNLNQNIFIKQGKDFYLSKGTDRSFEILFKALYEEDVRIVKPRDFLFTPSNANFKITNDLVVEAVEGDPVELENSTLFQDKYDDISERAYAPVTKVEPINIGTGKTFYKLSFDAGYNRDVRVDGSIYGTFVVHDKTKVIGAVATGSTTFNVDSTVGFPNSGELTVEYSDATIGIVSYTSKSINQFFGVSNVIGDIVDASNVGINTYTYGSSNVDQSEIKVNITSVLNKLNLPDDTHNFAINETAKIKSLGDNDTSFKAKNWFYNIAPVFEVSELEIIDPSDNTYMVHFFVDHSFRIGDKADLIDNAGNLRPTSTVIDVDGARKVTIKGQGLIDLTSRYTLRRNILKTQSTTFPEASLYSTNVQNLYVDGSKYLVASTSIPTYSSQPLNLNSQTITFSGTFVGEELQLVTSGDHGFYTGDAIYYYPQRVSEDFFDAGVLSTRETIKSSLFPEDLGVIGAGEIAKNEGLYFVQRINSLKIKLAKSRTNLSNSTFIKLNTAVTVQDNKITPHKFKLKRLEAQNIFREIDLPSNDGNHYKTTPGFTGILINGVEVLNYKSHNSIYYGKINSIEVISGGSNFDVLNPPKLNITDNLGVGATGNVAVSGVLKEIRIIDPGFDYVETPEINISGGNGNNAKASVNTKLITHKVNFDALANGSVDLNTNIIGFSTFHKFRNAERVIYKSNGQKGIAGLSTDSEYYASVITNSSVTLHQSKQDAIIGINTISLTDNGIGIQTLESFDKKTVVEAINVISGGSGYSNKEKTITPVGINTSIDTITLHNHSYQSGEIVKYTATGTAVGGLTSGSNYYVTKIDDDKFRLSNLGSTDEQKTFFFDTKQYVDLTSVGIGTHIFNYEDISITISGKIGISTAEFDGSPDEIFGAKIQPIVRGSVTSIDLSNQGSNYGDSEIINFNREPNVELSAGKNAQIKAVVNNGQITEILIQNSGSNYNSPPDIILSGSGIGCVLTPILEDGKLIEVRVIEGGIGYVQDTTTLAVSVPGDGAQFRALLQQWRINLVERHLKTFTGDDGFIAHEFSENRGLQFSHLYAPRKLRESIFARNQSGDILYGKTDLIKSNGTEIVSTDHSPIIGWAYDGNPIYGPYGYITKSGGAIAQMRSGYKLELQDGRPSTGLYPEGFFVEDYVHKQLDDDAVLDENNGRFCFTPEFPKGTYAYFATINDGPADSAENFNGFKRPVFPYLIGDGYQSTPNNFNYDVFSNQKDYKLDKTTWLRNTQPYNLIETKEVVYKYAFIPDDLKQTIDVSSVTPGKIEKVGISSSGDLYKVGDTIVFGESNTSRNQIAGFGADIEVSKVLGKEVSSISAASTTITEVEIYPAENGFNGQWNVISDNPHNFKSNEIIVISGLSTTSSGIEGAYNAGITTDTFAMTGIGTTTVSVDTAAVTGFVTFFNLGGNLKNIKPNDILKVNDEEVKVLNVDEEFSRVRVFRAQNGTTGTAHTVTAIVKQDPRVITINAGIKTTFTAKRNTELYFNPIESVSQGVGIGSTLVFNNIGIGLSELFVPTRSIFFKNHNLETGDELTYSTNGGNGLSVVDGTSALLQDGEKLFAAKITDSLIGIATVRVGLGSTGTFVGIASAFKNSTILAFTGIGTGVQHSLKTNYKPITGDVTRNKVNVSTGDSHGLVQGNTVDININPGVTTSIVVKYNDFNRRLILDPRTFVALDIDNNNNSIEIKDHRFSTGDKVICNIDSNTSDLVNNKIYYIVRIDSNNIKLSTSHYNSVLLNPVTIIITGTDSGSFSAVNPHVDLFKDSTVEFDVSDPSLGYVSQGSSYSAFEFNFYTDQNFTDLWEKTEDSVQFEVKKTGKIGVSADAKVSLTVNKNIPQNLFYRLKPIFENNLPLVKKEIVVDDEVSSGSQVEVFESRFNGEHPIFVAVGSTNTFSYTLKQFPEKTSYSTLTSLIEYTTDAKTALGPVADFHIKNGGQNYYSLPGITTITTEFGSNAIISVGSSSIGRIKKTKIQNIGFNFPSDTTLRPTVALPQVMKMKSLASIGSIGIASVGKGYAVAPTLLMFDGETKKQIKDIDLQFTLGDSQVQILNNTTGINPVTPIIIPTGNSNGVGISTVGFNTTTKDVTLTLSVGFSTENSFPFEVDDKVLVENVSIGIGSTGKGFNSAEYDYKLFTVTAVDANLGGIGIVTYSLADELVGGEFPGTYNPFNSAAARIIPQKYFPSFSVNLSSNNYLVGETVTSKSKEGKDISGQVETWDVKNEILVISGTEGFAEGEIIKGDSSNTQGIASSISSYKSDLTIDAFSKVENGWETDSGFLNITQQRLQDNDYYQNFSYSLRSAISFNVWDDVVSTLNHTLGYKKFSDYQLDSTATDASSMIVGLTTATTEVDQVHDLVGVGNLNTFSDFDLVKENSLIVPGSILSDEIIFSSRILQDFEESIGNRVLTIDDMSGSFNSNPRSTPFSVVETFKLAEHRAQKYITFVRDKRFYGQRQIMIVDLIHDGSFGYIQQYGRAETVYDQGSFDFSIVGSEGQLLFYPTRSAVNDYDIVALSYNLDDNLLGIGNTSVGTALIDSHSVNVPKANPSTNIVSIANTYRSAKILVEVTADSEYVGLYDEFGMVELNLVHDGTEVDMLDYAEMTTSLNKSNVSGFGTFSAYISGSDVKVDFHPNAIGIGTTAVVNAIVVAQSNESTTSESFVDLKHARLESRSTNIAASGSPTPQVVGDYPDDYDAAYFVIQVSDTSNGEYGISELIVIDDYDITFGTGQTYDTDEYAVVTTSGGQGITGLGTFYTGISTNNIVDSGGSVGIAATTQLIFTPLPNVATNVKVFMNAFRHQDDAQNQIDFNNSSIQVRSSDYTGTDRDIKRAFNLTHNQDTIFERSFEGNDSTIVDVDEDTIELPNHFFVSGEKINYVYAGAGTTQAIGIANTNGFVGIGFTNKLPNEVFAIKVDDNKIKVTDSARKALLSVPESVTLTNVGIGTSHRFVSTNANAKVLLCLDNIVQSPIVSTAVTTTLAKELFTTDDLVKLSGITSIFGGDLLRINEEILKIESVGVGSTNVLRVRRQWMGTNLSGHSTDSLVTKVNGNYNIVENVLNFVEAPYGQIPLSTTTNPPDSRDWTGISTSSSFQGRSFMRSGVPNTVNDTYYKNVVFDDISSEFNGINKDFDLESDGNNVTGIATENAVILINDVFQGPILNYSLNENLGITSIQFTGAASSTTDANVTSLPLGGVILSVGSTEGNGYQPLVAAGGTAVVSAGGTISSISIGNTGSGYRSGAQTVGVSVQQRDVEGTSVTSIGTASVSNGHITGVAVTNWNAFYKPRDIRQASYTHTTGVTTITTATPHGLSLGDEVKLSGIAFTCTYSSAASRDVQFATYNNTNGTMTVTTASSHGLKVGKDVILTGLAFTCGLDNGVSEHIYPRNRDRFFDTSISIGSTTNNSITVNVTAAKDLDQYAHTFVSASADAVVTGGTYNHEFIGTADNAIISGGAYNHTFASATTGGVTVAGIGTTTPTSATYDANTGDMVLTINGHGAIVGSAVSFAIGAITFTCDMDNNSTNHPYPRATDPIVSIGSTVITSSTNNTITVNVGTSKTVGHNVTDADYNPATGTLVLTSPNHGLKAGVSIRIPDNALTFTCDMDAHSTKHTYPRSTDPISNTAVSIASTTENTLTINVGTSTEVKYNVSAASYNASTGQLDLTIGSHNLTSGTSIKIAKESLVFTCSKDGNATEHKYPRGGDPGYNGLEVIGVSSPTKFDVNVGVSTVPTFYKSGGKVQGVIIAPRDNNNSASGTDPAAGGTNVLGIIDNHTFTINSGISTTPHFYARGGTVEKPLDVIIDEPLSYTNIPLAYSSDSVSGVGSGASVDVVVGQGSSIVDFSITNTGYGFGIGEILTLPIGGATGIPTTSSYKEFQLTIDEVFTDEFTGWTLGTLQPLDTPQGEFDGDTRTFQLKLNNDIISIRAAKGSKIDVQDVILVFVNDILQIPGKGYTFTGGSLITFTEPPKAGDTCKIIFYKGSGGIDVKSRDIIETVKIGDDLQITYDPSKGQESWLQENERSVLRVDSTDIVTTNPYFGPGNTEDETLVRPVSWSKQTEDRIINDLQVGKDRELYEPNIFPAANVLKTVGIGSTTIYVESVRPFFDPKNENSDESIRTTLQDKVTIVSQDLKVGATVSASISGNSVSSITVSDGGKGYTSAPSVSIQTPVGLGSTATATAAITNGSVTSITVTSGGTGYTSTPQVLVDPPSLISETNDVLSYNGDSGTVVGFGTTVVSNIDKLIFDLYIPQDSFLRDTDIVGTATTLSGISIGDYFVVSNSNIGFAQTNIVSRALDNTIVATGRSFFDNVYQVESTSVVSVANTNIGISTVGTALTNVIRVQSKISGISTFTFSSNSIYFDSTNYTFDNQNSDIGGGSNTGAGYTGGFINRPFLGNFSWGRIELQGRSELNEYSFFGQNGVLGIGTGSLVTRTNGLRSKNYDS